MNVKPGDLAIVINGTTTPEMIGFIVMVEKIAVDMEIMEFPGARIRLNVKEPSWIVRSISNEALIPWRGASGKLHRFHSRAIADRFLRPVSGLSDTEQADQQEPVKEIA